MTNHEMYDKLLAYSKIDINSQDPTTNQSYFTWALSFMYDPTSGDLCIGTAGGEFNVVRLEKDGTLHLNPKPTPEEIKVIESGSDNTYAQYMLNERYSTQNLSEAVERITHVMGISSNLKVKFGSRSDKLEIWSKADEVTPIKKRRCTQCGGMRKVSGWCESKTVIGCTASGCEESQRRIAYFTSMNVKITLAMISHDDIRFCKHGLKSNHETKLSAICQTCNGEGKISVGGNSKFRDWTARNSIIINPDLTYRIEPEKASA